MLLKYTLVSIVIFISTLTASAVAVTPQEAIPTTMSNWELKAMEASKAWGISYQEFINEAEEFLLAYKESNRSLSYINSIEDLIILKKPSIDTTYDKEKTIKFLVPID